MIKMSNVNKTAVGEAASPTETVTIENDVKLYVFNSNEIKDNYVVVCPGGGYMNCEIDREGYRIAAKLNELGYTAFVLEYRTGKKITTPKAPLTDLANAIKYVDDNADKYGVTKGNYVLCGFSAGGNLIGLFGTEKFGYAQFDGIARPNALVMGYPWSDPASPSFNGNLADYAYYASLNGNGSKAFLGSNKSYDEMQVSLWIDENYPRTFIMHGENDVIAPVKEHSDKLTKALEEKNIPFTYKKCDDAPHGCGLGIGTSAEGWLEEAMDFSNKYWLDAASGNWYYEEYEPEPRTANEVMKAAGGFMCGVCHPNERFEQQLELGGEWSRFDLTSLPLDENDNETEGYVAFKARAKSYVDKGLKVFAVTPMPGVFISAGLDPRIEENIPRICAQLRYMVTDLQGLVGAFQIMNEPTETMFRTPLTLEESAEFMGLSLKIMNRYKGNTVVGYNVSANNFIGYLDLMSDYNDYTDYIGIDVYLGCFESTTHSLGFVPAQGWIAYVNMKTHRPVMLTEFGYISAGAPKSDDEKLEILRSFGAVGNTLQEAEAYSREHIIEIIENENFPQSLANLLRIIGKDEEGIANNLFGGPGVAVDYRNHLYMELGETVNVDGYPHTLEGQAKFFEDFFTNVVYEYDYLCGTIMYCFSDAPYCGYCGQSGCPVETRWGLLTVDGEKKPSFYVVKDAFEDLKNRPLDDEE